MISFARLRVSIALTTVSRVAMFLVSRFCVNHTGFDLPSDPCCIQSRLDNGGVRITYGRHVVTLPITNRHVTTLRETSPSAISASLRVLVTPPILRVPCEMKLNPRPNFAQSHFGVLFDRIRKHLKVWNCLRVLSEKLVYFRLDFTLTLRQGCFFLSLSSRRCCRLSQWVQLFADRLPNQINERLWIDTRRSTKFSYIYTICRGPCQDVFYGRLWVVSKLFIQS